MLPCSLGEPSMEVGVGAKRFGVLQRSRGRRNSLSWLSLVTVQHSRQQGTALRAEGLYPLLLSLLLTGKVRVQKILTWVDYTSHSPVGRPRRTDPQPLRQPRRCSRSHISASGSYTCQSRVLHRVRLQSTGKHACVQSNLQVFEGGLGPMLMLRPYPCSSCSCRDDCAS